MPSCFFFFLSGGWAVTPFCGAVLYYVWRKQNPAAATYANRVSWASWLLWIAAGLWFRQVHG